VKALAAAVAVASLAGVSAPAAAQATTDTTSFEFTEAVYNSCNAETVIVNGVLTVATTIDVVGNDLRYRMTNTMRGSGLSDKQVSYTYNNVSSSTFATRAAQAFVDSTDWQFVLLKRQGGGRGANLMIGVLRHTTVNQLTGATRVGIDRFITKCV
jgi:hypothetical protein